MIAPASLLLALALLVQAPAQAPAQPAVPVQRGLSVLPETVTVGDTILVRVRVRAPADAQVEFPAGPDSGAAVEALSTRELARSGDPSALDVTATYRLVAWDVGSLPLLPGAVVVRTPEGEQRLSLADARVFVRSVLPADSAQRVPKPARAPIEFPRPWWHWLLLALVVLALLGVLLWWLWRRRRRAAAAPMEVDPYQVAEREFARVEAMGLLDAGERGRFVALMVEVLRDYLAAREPGAEQSLTSTELLLALRQRRTVPTERLARVLAEADLIKFARKPVTPERARELAREARAIARDVEKAEAAARARAEAAAKAAAAGKEAA